MTFLPHRPLFASFAFLRCGLSVLLALCVASPVLHAQQPPRTADYIIAVVNRELVTAGELQLRLNQIREEAQRNGARVPSEEELRQQVLNALIDERVQITHAREVGQKVEDAELDRAVANVASQNQLTVQQLRERLRIEGVDFARFRSNIRDQMQVERVREREVQGRIRVTDAEVDTWLSSQRAAAAKAVQYNIAQILVRVPEGANAGEVAARQARAQAALARVRGGEAFEDVNQQLSEDLNKPQGGQLGMRSSERLPEAFVAAVRELQPGDVAPTVLRSEVGYHVLKLVDRRLGSDPAIVTQTHARHILLRPSPRADEQAVLRRLQGFKAQIAAGAKTFEQVARESSEDGSATQGGDLGWVSGGSFVPEFEDVMNALPLRTVSDPVISRFGVHLIEVLERRETKMDPKQQRDLARKALREQKFESALADWVRELRNLAYIEMREAPQL